MKFITFTFLVFGLIIFFSGCTDSNKKNTSEIKDKVYWTCSMHPQINKDAPGKCSICGMDLIKVNTTPVNLTHNHQANFPKGHGEVTLSNEQKEMIGVKTGEVVKKQLFKSIDTAGRVAFDPELYAAENEFIEAIRQDESIRNSPLRDVKQSAKAMIASAKMRLKILGLSDQQISLLQNSSFNTSNTSYLIPKKGDHLWIYAEVYEMDLPYIRQGLRVQIRSQLLEGKILDGNVVSVDRVINPITRTAKVRITLSDTSINLRPESYVEVSILSPLGEQIVAPFDAIFDTGKESWVFIVKHNGTIEPRKISIKDYAGDEVALSSGVTPGEIIVTSANFLIDSESRIVGAREETQSNAPPVCPDGKKWHEQMKHCM